VTITSTPVGPTQTEGPTGHRGRPREGLQRERRFALRVSLAPLVVLLLALTIIPTAYILIVSFTNAAATNHNTRFVGFENYVKLFTDPNYWIVLARTVAFVIVAVAIQLALGLGVASAMAGLKRGSAVIRALILLPMAAAPIAMYFTWRQILNASYGPIDYLLGLIGIPHVDWLGNAALALPTLVFVDTWQWTPFIFIILAGGLATIPGEVYEAAEVDGATRWQRFTLITLPLLMPYIAVAVLFRTIDALKTFDSVQILTAGGPGSSTTMLNYSIFQQGISFLNFGTASASAVVFLIICTLLANALLRGLRRTDI
jgi:multiple sugar transport system permease protein